MPPRPASLLFAGQATVLSSGFQNHSSPGLESAYRDLKPTPKFIDR